MAYGAPRVEVEDGWLRAGRARISGEFLGGAEPLDPAATRRVAGPEADARAYLLLRPYLKRTVRVTVRDDRDPAPYWLVAAATPSTSPPPSRRSRRSVTPTPPGDLGAGLAIACPHG